MTCQHSTCYFYSQSVEIFPVYYIILLVYRFLQQAANFIYRHGYSVAIFILQPVYYSESQPRGIREFIPWWNY